MRSDLLKSDGVTVINELAYEIHQTAVEKGWWDAPRNKGEILMLIVTEAGEAMESLRTPEMLPSEHIPAHTALAEELVDILIRVFDFALSEKIDIGAALIAKMQYNNTRSYRYGNKKA